MRTAVAETRTLAAQPTAVRRAVLRADQIEDWLSGTLGDLAESLRRRRIVPTGFPFSRRHQAPGGLVVVEAGFPLALPIAADGTTLVSALPAGPVVVTAHSGPYDEVGVSYELIADWLQRHEAQPAGEPWEIYHAPPIGRPDAWHTEIVQPYRRAD